MPDARGLARPMCGVCKSPRSATPSPAVGSSAQARAGALSTVATPTPPRSTHAYSRHDSSACAHHSRLRCAVEAHLHDLAVQPGALPARLLQLQPLPLRLHLAVLRLRLQARHLRTATHRARLGAVVRLLGLLPLQGVLEQPAGYLRNVHVGGVGRTACCSWACCSMSWLFSAQISSVSGRSCAASCGARASVRRARRQHQWSAQWATTARFTMQRLSMALTGSCAARSSCIRCNSSFCICTCPFM